MMSVHSANSIFFNEKKIKIGRPEHLLTPLPLLPITSHFCEYLSLKMVDRSTQQSCAIFVYVFTVPDEQFPE